MAKVQLVFLFVSLLVLQSCTRCNTDCPPRFSDFVFVLVDEGGRSYIEAGLLVPQQVRVFQGSPEGQQLSLSSFGLGFQYFVPQLDKESEYYIIVDSRRTIKLNITFASRNSECCGQITEVTNVLADGAEIGFAGGWVIPLLDF
jgi:hypothetical protein